MWGVVQTRSRRSSGLRAYATERASTSPLGAGYDIDELHGVACGRFWSP